MNRIKPVDRNTNQDSVRKTFDAVEKHVFTNYFNRVAETEIDFRRVAARSLVRSA